MGLFPSLAMWEGHHGEKVATVIQEIRFNILSILVLNVFFIKILKSFIYLSVLLI